MPKRPLLKASSLGDLCPLPRSLARASCALAFISCSMAHSHGPALFCLGLSDVLVGIGLVDLQLSTDVLSDVDVGNINGQDLKCCSVQSLESTTLEMVSGFSNTALWFSAEPMVVTIPSPTLARDGLFTGTTYPASEYWPVRSPWPLLSAGYRLWLPLSPWEVILITLGFTLICTASSTSRPARSMAVVALKSRG